MDNYLPGLADGDAGERSRKDGKLLYVPSNWGTEALVYNKEKLSWRSAVAGRPCSIRTTRLCCVRTRRSLPWAAAWKRRASCRVHGWMATPTWAPWSQLWDIALAEAVKAKGNVVQFWSGENEANAGFLANGATVGLCWDSTGYNLRKDGYGYVAPVEGAFAWHQGFVHDEERRQRRTGA